jgi:hypothetical protein
MAIIGTIGSLGMLTAAVYLGVQRHADTVTSAGPLPASVQFPPIITSDSEAPPEFPAAFTNAQNDAHAAFQRLGLTSIDADRLANRFEENGLQPASAYDNATACVRIAEACGETVSDVAGAVLGAFRYAHGDSRQTSHIIFVLEKYARLYPRAGVWRCASQAASGEIYQNEYLAIRMNTPDYSAGRLIASSHSHVKELQPVLEVLYNGAKR